MTSKRESDAISLLKEPDPLYFVLNAQRPNFAFGFFARIIEASEFDRATKLSESDTIARRLERRARVVELFMGEPIAAPRKTVDLAAAKAAAASVFRRERSTLVIARGR